MHSRPKFLSCPHCHKKIELPAKITSLYPQIVTDAEGNIVNVVIHIGNTGRGMGSTKAALGLLIQELLEWGCPPDRIAKKLIGHASGAGHLVGVDVSSVEDGVGKAMQAAAMEEK